MGLKTGLVIGFGVGYWFGAKAGEARYEQLETFAAKVRTSGAYQASRERVQDTFSKAMDDGMTRARGLLAGATDTARQPDLPFYDQDRER